MAIPRFPLLTSEAAHELGVNIAALEAALYRKKIPEPVRARNNWYLWFEADLANARAYFARARRGRKPKGQVAS
jgi:hypothetical protein